MKWELTEPRCKRGTLAGPVGGTACLGTCKAHVAGAQGKAKVSGRQSPPMQAS